MSFRSSASLMKGFRPRLVCCLPMPVNPRSLGNLIPCGRPSVRFGTSAREEGLAGSKKGIPNHCPVLSDAS